MGLSFNLGSLADVHNEISIADTFRGGANGRASCKSQSENQRLKTQEYFEPFQAIFKN